MAEVRFVSWEQLLDIHRRCLEKHGGSDGMRDVGLVESALATPYASFGGQYLHEDLAAMASAYLFHISENQGFIDGNKRTAVTAMLVFLDLNGQYLNASDDELYDLIIRIADNSATKADAASFIRDRLKLCR